jgi:DNA-binding winged helix-turn-helix (wHTH) protein/TolB-like protein/Tfp pilus assembly protein PilF
MASPKGEDCVRFGGFELSLSAGELRKAGALIKLQPQPMRLLTLLVSRPGELVTREEIRQVVWGEDTTVEFDQGLNFCIRQIRAAIGDDAREPLFIETVPRRGYRFIAAFTRPEASIAGQAQDVPATAMTAGLRRRTWPWFAGSAAAVLVLAGVPLWWFSHASEPRTPNAILVRPFAGLGLAPEDAWLGDALTRQLIVNLADTKALHVIPWSASLALKGQSISVRDLGKRFHVDAILDGSVEHVNGLLRVTAQLVDVATERTLWSHQDERDALDLGGVQEGLLRDIADALKLRLAEPATPVARRRPADLETYNLYLRALYLSDEFTAEGVGKSVADFEEVIRRAPGYAPAHAGLANALNALAFVQPVKSKQPLARATDEAQAAIALDPGLGEAHAALAHSFFNAWDWPAADREFQRALRLDPDSATVRQLYGLFLASQGRSEEAVREARRAAELAPTSVLISYCLAQVYFRSGRYDEAIMQSRRTLELDKGFQRGLSLLARAYTLKGMTSEAAATLDEWERYESEPMQPLLRAHVQCSAGQREKGRIALDEWQRSSPRIATPPMEYAIALISCSEKERALDALRQSVDRHVPSMLWLKSTPELSAVRSDARFVEAVARMRSN